MTQEQRQQYQDDQILIWALQQKTWPLEGVSKQQAYTRVIKLLQIFGLTDLSKLSEKIFEILSAPPEQPAPNLPPSEILKADIENEIKANQERKLNLIYPTLNEQIKNIQKQYAQKISKQLAKEEPQLEQNPSLKEFISQEVSLKLANNLPQVVSEQNFNEKEYQEIVEKTTPKIVEELKKIGLEPTKIVSEQNFSERLKTETFDFSKTIAATPRNTVVIEKIIEIEKPQVIPKEIPPLPKEILTQINQLQETPSFLPHPKVAAAFIQKMASTPQATLIKNAIENAPLSWQEGKNWLIVKEIVSKRIFTEDIQATIDFLKEKGVEENHPLIRKLQDKLFYFQDAQINPKTGKDFPWVTILKRNSYLDELLDRKRVYDDDLKGYLRSAREPLYVLNKFRFISNTSQRFMKFITGGRYESVGILIRKTIYQKAVKPILIKLGKTAAGKAVKEGAKKFSIWATTKLGLQLGIKGAAVAAAPETLGVSILISLAIDAAMFLVNMIRKGFSLIRKAWYQLSEDPEKAVISLVVGGTLLIIPTFLALGPILIPLLTIIGVPLAVGGSAALLTGGLKAASVGSAATTLSVQTAATTATIGGNVVLGSVVGVGVGALIITQITASAFLTPEIEELGSPYIELTKDATFTGNQETGENGQIVYKIDVGAKDKKLIDITINDKFSVICEEDKKLNINSGIGSPPGEIEVGDSWTAQYTIPTDISFKDCLITNRLEVIAKTEDEEEQRRSVNAIIIIGNPPSDCPHIWPVDGEIAISRYPCEVLTFKGRTTVHGEAIDIPGDKREVLATHTGTVTRAEFAGDWGNVVEITSSCGGKGFVSRYAHLKIIKVGIGQEVTPRTAIGISGSTGRSTGAHLHYQFIGLKMQCDNIPECIKNTCP